MFYEIDLHHLADFLHLVDHSFVHEVEFAQKVSW